MHRVKAAKHCWVLGLLIILGATLQNARSQQAKEDPKPRLYVVATSHLDSQWNWTVQDTIRKFVPIRSAFDETHSRERGLNQGSVRIWPEGRRLLEASNES